MPAIPLTAADRRALQTAISELMTCAPGICPRERACLRIAQFAAAALDSPEAIASHDPIVDGIRAQFANRSRVGQAKYGRKMTRDDYGLLEWLEHLKTELMDAVLYGEAAIHLLEHERQATGDSSNG
jgi:hypothetical protein